jgi:hypothetical protein
VRPSTVDADVPPVACAQNVATEEETEMLSGEMAKFQIADRVREADAERRARQTRRSRMADERSFTRRVGRAAIAVVVWPVRH